MRATPTECALGSRGAYADMYPLTACSSLHPLNLHTPLLICCCCCCCLCACLCTASTAGPTHAGLLDCAAASPEVLGVPVPGLARADDAAAQVTLPFAIRMFDSSYTSLTISSNGWMALGNAGAREPCTLRTAWPDAACLGTGPVIAALWGALVDEAGLDSLCGHVCLTACDPLVRICLSICHPLMTSR